jgi:DNA anti-recombination protein RmuC
MEAALKALSGSGATGAVLAVAFALLAGTIGVLGWALKRLVDSALKQQDKFGDFMEALTASLNAIATNCTACKSDSAAELRAIDSSIKSELQHVVWASHDKATLETNASIERAVDRLEESLTGAATEIRTSNEKMVHELENSLLKAQLATASA